MIEITDKWQCVKCKLTKVQIVQTTTLANGQITVKPEDVHLIMCHDHVMRNLSEAIYTKENEINNSGARTENVYRG